ncbi:monocarboxylate transporter 12-like isoform X1 [Argiope bruennichi]|uniref:monocarboxylate transporter 12-like isoform X1 n=1 Tax=Argiope bruennichi TaxID=94029 RepID=UPI0024942217|nr:monocarboxylate transporter 12-like isoform X1 [Argiope bruennichi]
MVKRIDAPDSARSWAVAIAGCLINSLMSGLTRSTGLIYVALIDTFGASRFQANLPFTARIMIKNLGGPVVGALGQRFGPRNVTLAGGVLSSVGMLLCAFAPNIIWITILCGGVHGFGVSMASTLGLIMVTQWFMKHKATGTGLAFSGSCFGSLILPFLIEKMLENFGLFGCFILTGGLILNVLPAALLMKEPSWMQKSTKKTVQVVDTSGSPSRNGLEDCSELQNSSIIFRNKSKNQPTDSVLNSTDGINNLSFSSSTMDVRCDNINQTEETKSCEEKTSPIPPKAEDMQQQTSLLKAILIISCDPMFYMISISLATYAMVLDPVYIVLVDFMMDKGMTEKISKYFISAFSIGDLVGRLSFGWITDRKLMTVKTFMMMMQISHGVCYLLLAVFYDFYVLLFIVTLFGLITGASLVMIPILVQIYLPSVQSLAIGCIAFATGTPVLMVPFLIGYFRDEIGSYDGMVYAVGGVEVFIGSLWIFEPLLLKLRTKINKKKEMTVISI